MDFSWSKKEKQIAKNAHDMAYAENLKEVIKAVKSQKIESWQDLAALKNYIKEQEKRAAMLFDYRYSMLIFAFGSFIRQGLISFDDVQGLSEEKIEKITQIANLEL